MSPPDSADARAAARQAVARTLDHAILTPNLSDEAVRTHVRAVFHLPLASVCVKPHTVGFVAPLVHGTPIAVCTVIGFPHGIQAPPVKALEAELAFRDGATEVDMVVNTGLVLSHDWPAVADDIAAVRDVARRRRGIVKVIFETDFLPDDAVKIRLCEICSELAVDFVKTSTGFGYVKGREGGYDAAGATDHDLILMRRHCPPSVGVKASGGVRTLARARRVLELGCTRIGTSSSLAILAEFDAA